MFNLAGVHQSWRSWGSWVVRNASDGVPCFVTIVCVISRRDDFLPSFLHLFLICNVFAAMNWIYHIMYIKFIIMYITRNQHTNWELIGHYYPPHLTIK